MSCTISFKRCPTKHILTLLYALLFLTVVSQQHTNGDHQSGEEDIYYCIADFQATDDELLNAMNWACANGGNCTAIQQFQTCYYPNTTLDHASYAFNSYYQNMKHSGGSCYFTAAALLTGADPSHDSCKFEHVP